MMAGIGVSNYKKIEGERSGSLNYIDKDGFGYCREKKRDTYLYLRCKFMDRNDKDNTCSGRAVIDLDTDNLRRTCEHKCTPSPLDFQVLEAKTEMKKAAAATSTPFSSLHRSVLEKVNPEVATKIPIRTVINTMRSVRRRT
jgi:hypothetical protein